MWIRIRICIQIIEKCSGSFTNIDNKHLGRHPVPVLSVPRILSKLCNILLSVHVFVLICSNKAFGCQYKFARSLNRIGIFHADPDPGS
jgi:hypothetical protein